MNKQPLTNKLTFYLREYGPYLLVVVPCFFILWFCYDYTNYGRYHPIWVSIALCSVFGAGAGVFITLKDTIISAIAFFTGVFVPVMFEIGLVLYTYNVKFGGFKYIPEAEFWWIAQVILYGILLTATVMCCTILIVRFFSKPIHRSHHHG